MDKKIILVILSLITVLAACGSPVNNSQTGQTPVSVNIMPTRTSSPGAPVQPVFTEIPTFTPVPAFTQPIYPTNDSIADLLKKFQETLISPSGQWIAYREPNRIRVINAETTQVWTLPCELFKECIGVLPVKWSRDGQFFYFASAPALSGYPEGITLFSAFARIDVISGRWELLLPDSTRYYDLTFSPNDEFLAYTQSTGGLVERPSVTLGILEVKDAMARDVTTLRNEFYGGNIVWSPFRNRIVFQTQNAEGSSIVYYDMDLNVLRYVVRDDPGDFYISAWGENNLVSIQRTDWVTRANTDWLLNPFNNELVPAP